MLPSILLKLRQGTDLSMIDAYNLQSTLLENDFETSDLIEIFRLLDNHTLDKDALLGFYKSSKEKTVSVSTDLDTLDIVGTGGDGLNTFNISSVSSFVVASCGVAVAKHGNRAASGLCGSGDVLEQLGVKIELSPSQAKSVLKQCGFVFLFAKSFNPAFRFAGPARKLYGKKTYFNILGPLLNPTSPKYLLIGLSDFSKAKIMAQVLANSGIKKSWIVQSDSGMDEISPFGNTQVLQIEVDSNGRVETEEFLLKPENYGYSEFSLEDIKGGDKIVNSKIFTDILQGEGGAGQNAAVVLNSAAALVVAGKVKNYEEGIILAKNVLRSGKAWDKFIEFRDLSNRM
jgi:anthranilate phosphoribosyltransferase